MITAVTDREFQLRIGEKARFESERMEILFAAVTEDSRCPEGAVCVWEGQAVISIEISRIGRPVFPASLINRKGYPDQARTGFDSYQVELIRIDPYPVKDKKIENSEYIAALIVSRL